MIPNRKQLEMYLSSSILGFEAPKVEAEQYMTPPNVAANLIYRAYELQDITEKHILDLCAGTGILGCAAYIMGAQSVRFIEQDVEVKHILSQNIKSVDAQNTSEIIIGNVLEQNELEKVDTIIMNPPFGIQQKNTTDLDVLKFALTKADAVYSVHDGSEKNQDFIPKFVKKNGCTPTEYFIDEFRLPQQFVFHTEKERTIKVMILRTEA